jgi:hypothetical protein
MRFVTDGHSPAVSLIRHPSGCQLAPPVAAEFDLLDPSIPKSSHNRQVLLSVKRVKGVIDGDLARIAGIIL